MSGGTPLAALAAYSGPPAPRMLLVGEAWGENEELARRPFVGESGKELFRMLGEASRVAAALHGEVCAQFRYGLAWVRHRMEWLERAGVGMTNVLALRPPGNQLESLCDVKKLASPASLALGPISRGKFLRNEFLGEVSRLEEEIALLSPNIIVALGNTACWALLSATNIGTIRGTCEVPSHGPAAGRKVLATYHPAGVLRNWAWRPVVCQDLTKAFQEAQAPELVRPRRQVLVSPSLPEIWAWVTETLASSPEYLACDIETGGGQIKCVGFARNESEAMVVPFWLGAAEGSYWPDRGAERDAWEVVRALLASPIPKVFQNGVYDLQYLLRLGLVPAACLEDTMLLHHSLYPELQKGLGFLGSIYTNETSWKQLRKFKPDTEKRDE